MSLLDTCTPIQALSKPSAAVQKVEPWPGHV